MACRARCPRFRAFSLSSFRPKIFSPYLPGKDPGESRRALPLAPMPASNRHATTRCTAPTRVSPRSFGARTRKGNSKMIRRASARRIRSGRHLGYGYRSLTGTAPWARRRQLFPTCRAARGGTRPQSGRRWWRAATAPAHLRVHALQGRQGGAGCGSLCLRPPRALKERLEAAPVDVGGVQGRAYHGDEDQV